MAHYANFMRSTGLYMLTTNINVHPHGSPDCPRNDLVHGPRPHHALSRNHPIKILKKRVKVLKISTFTLALVGITGLEPATSRPPDVCATNCAKSRFAGAKVHTFSESAKFSGNFLFFFLNFTPLRLMNSNNIRIFACSTIRYNRNGTI